MDVLVVGCGFCGAVAARILAEAGRSVLAIDRRHHIAGNMYDSRDQNGCLVQLYGPHCFHTDDEGVYALLSKHHGWYEYRLKCRVQMGNKTVVSPFDFSAIDDLYPAARAEAIKQALQREYPNRCKVHITELLKSGVGEIRAYARRLFAEDYRPYTAKQWGMQPGDIDASVLARVPVRIGYADTYFDDRYQLQPEGGYTELFKSLLSHPGIRVRLGTDFMDGMQLLPEGISYRGRLLPVVYTGPLDELFGFEYGPLPYRSLRFEYRAEGSLPDKAEGRQPDKAEGRPPDKAEGSLPDRNPMENRLPAPIVAYPLAEGYTRITDYGQLPDQPRGCWVAEYPLPHDPSNGTEPYYPVLTGESAALYARYAQRAASIANLHPCGRLADFRYYNMDQAVRRAMDLAGSLI